LGQIPRCRLHVVSNIRWPAVRLSRFTATFHQLSDVKNEAAQVDEIRRICRAVRADVLLPVVESGIRLVSQNRDALTDEVHIPLLPTPELLETVVNKFSLARCLEQHGLPTPATFLYTSVAVAKNDLARLSFPVLLKPVIGGGGVGIRRFDKPDELLAALCAHPYEPGSCILQSYVRGRDVDCSTLCRDGKILAHTMQTNLFPRRDPFGPDDTLRFEQHAAAFSTVEKTLAALRWNGIAHFDMREDERNGRFYIVDFTTRFWTTLLGSLAAGVNFPHLAGLAALGIEFPPPVFRQINYFTAKAALKEIAARRSRDGVTGLALALNDPWPRALNFVKRTTQYANRA
jgi:D-aspartate ligase